MITIGTGIGGGIIINKKIYSGFNYAGGESGIL
jgi:glucokinase